METIMLYFLQKVDNASKNVRYIVVLIALASIVSSIGVWNSREKSWQGRRIQFYEYQIKWHDCFLNKNSEDSLLDTYRTDPESIEKYFQIKSYYLEHSYSKEMLNQLLVNLKTSNFNNIFLVNVPIVGTSFDINDIGIVSGLTFIIALMVLLYSLMFKYNQIKNSFEVFRESRDQIDYKKFLKLLLINQVLTVDRYKVGEIAAGKFGLEKIIRLRCLPLSLYMVPFITHTFIFIFDVCTFRIGIILGQTYSLWVCIISGFLAFLILLITIFIYIQLNSIDKLWKEIYHELKKVEDGDLK
jgi:hypothetical protein